MESKLKERESGIELLKILAIFLIVISHVTQSLTHTNLKLLNVEDCMINLNNATQNIQYFVLICMRYLGILGNFIFVISSSWFLIGNKKNNNKKIIQLVLDVFIISLSILAIFLFLGIDITKKEIIKSIFPTISATNWFITCYILFLLVTPLLNKILDNITKQQLLRINITFIILYWIISFIKPSFFTSKIILFITIFFITAYIKLFLSNFANRKKMNIICLLFGIILFIILMYVTNILGLRFNFFENKLLYWCKNDNPILLLIAVSLFNIFRNIKFTNKFVNLVSSLSLYIYLTHENLLVGNYLRLYIWKYIHDKFTYNYIVIETLVYSAILFIVTMIIALIYKYTLQKITSFISTKICNSKKLRNTYIRIENEILKVK